MKFFSQVFKMDRKFGGILLRVTPGTGITVLENLKTGIEIGVKIYFFR
jgi:hypothetical protein